MPLVRAPDGKIYRLADGMSPEDMKRKIEAAAPGTYPDYRYDSPLTSVGKALSNMVPQGEIAALGGRAATAEIARSFFDPTTNYTLDEQGRVTHDYTPTTLKPGAPIEEYLAQPASKTMEGWTPASLVMNEEQRKNTARELAKSELAELLKARQPIKNVQPRNVAPGDLIGETVYNVASAVPDTLISLGAGLAAPATRGASIGMLNTYFALKGGGQTYIDAREKGLPPSTALFAAGINGASEVVTEAIAGKVFGEGGGKTLLGTFLKTGGTEVLTEEANTAINLLVSSQILHEDMTLDQVVNQLRETAITAGLTGGGVGAALHAAVNAGVPKPDERPDAGPAAVELDLGAPSPATNSVALNAMTAEQQAASAPVQQAKENATNILEQTKRLALPAPTIEDEAPSVAVTPPPPGETVREKQAVKTAQLLAAAREVTTPVGAFSVPEVGTTIAGKVNLWRSRTGRNIDAPITVADMQAARVEQPLIDELVISRKPVTKIGTEASAQQAGTISAGINADINQQRYNDAVAAVRKAGRFTLKTVQDATGLTNVNEARAIRDQMVQRGEIIQTKPNTFKLPEQPKTEATKAAPIATYTVAPAAPETVAVKKDGKIHGVYTTQKEAAAEVRALRAREKETGTQPGRVEVVNGGVDAEGKAIAGRPAFAVYENSYDEAGNSVGRTIVSTHATEEGAANAAKGLNNQPKAQRAAATAATASAKPTRGQPSPAAPLPQVPDVIAGREQEIIAGLDKLAKQRGVPTLGVKVKLVGSITDPSTGATVEGSYLNGVVRIALDKLSPDMTTEEIIDALAAVMDHELIHALRDAGLLADGTPAWKILVNYAAQGRHPDTGLTFLQWAAQSPEDGGYSDMSPSIQIEEAMAEAFRYWAKNRRAVGGAPGTVFNQIARWFKNLTSSIPADLFRAVETGSLVRANIKPPASKRMEAVDAMADARAKMTAAATPEEAADAQRDFLRARDQAEADRVGRVGPRTVLGTTPSDEFMIGPRASFDTVEALNAKAETLKLAPTPNYNTPDTGFMRKLADAYQNAKHQPSDTAVFKAYSALTTEVRSLFDALNVKVVPWRQSGQPYIDQRDLIDDIVNNGEVKMRLSAEMFPTHPTRKHPMQEQSSVVAADGTALTHDDLMRVVTEAFGYAPVSSVASEVGDYRAYHTIKGMFSERAQKALPTEMLAQSAWHNYGPKMRLDDGSIAPEGALGFVEPVKREFAERKATILPDAVLVEPVQAEAIDASGITKYSRGIGFRQDNPAVSRGDTEWLDGKIKMAATRPNRIGGAITGYLERPIRMNPALIDALPGQLGEQPALGQPKYDAVLADVQENGWDFGARGTVLVGVNDRGDAYVIEGNNRAAVATAMGVPAINVDVRWYNGGETVDGSWSPASVATKAEARYSRGVNPQVNTPEFKRWFGDSKVVDATGRPLVLYHSTTYGDFDTFKKAAQRKGMAGYGFYFTDKEGANIYADYGMNFQMPKDWQGNEKKVNIVPVYLSMSNPLVVDNISDVSARYGKADPGSFGQGREYGGMPEDAKTAIQRAGFDGVITNEYVKKQRDGSYKVVDPSTKGAIKHPVYVAFEPTQIKSATGNTGAFDPTNPDIRYSRGSLQTRMQPGGDTPDRISTRQPGTQRGLAVANPLTDNLIIDLNAMKASPAAFAHNMRLLKTYPGFVSQSNDPDQIAEDFINFVVGNLTYLHDRVPAEMRRLTKRWYDGARKIAERWSADYNVPDYVAAGVLASLSPQKDWYQNVSLAERVLDIYTAFTTGNNRAFRPTRAMAATAARIYAKEDYAQDVRTVLNAPFMDMPDALTKAMWVRIYDETYNPRGFRKVDPEGNFVGAPEGNVAWGSNTEIAKAISVLENPSRENASERMGEKHKVRNFFNNILAPNAPWGDVTIDTHAVAAALMRPLSGSSAEVHHNFGSSPEKAKQPIGWTAAKNIGDSGAQGTYGIYAEAYRRAAEQLGILPRELQSITWEAVRGLFPAIDKRNATKVQQVLNVWNQVSSGEIPVDAARGRVEALAGGINDPTWLRSDSEGAAPVAATSYEGELARARVQRAGAGELGAGNRYARRANAASAGTGVQKRPDFVLYSRGVNYGPVERSLLDKVSTAKTYNVGSPQFYEMLDEVMPGGKHYGKADRSAAAVVMPVTTSAPAFSRDYDGNVFFGGDIAYQQLQMTRDGDRGAVLTYMAPEDFLRLADQQPMREQRLFNEAAGAGYKFNTMPSLVVESGKTGAVPVLNSDGVAIARALLGQAKTIPVVLYPSGNGQIENVDALTGNDQSVDILAFYEFDIERRGPRHNLSSVAFNAWFKQSAVADEAGAPKRMYHNTKAASSFGVFATHSSEFGSHFGTPEQANDRVPEKGHGYPVYLSVQNPVRLADRGAFEVIDVAQQLRDMGIIDRDQYDAVRSYTVNGIVMLQDILTEKGYDGVVYLNRREGFEVSDYRDWNLPEDEFKAKYPEAQDSYIVFQPTQVKSAIANRGTWSSADPDIRYSRGRDRTRVTPSGGLAYSAVHDRVDGALGEFFRNLGRSKAGVRVGENRFSIFDYRIATQDSFLSVKDMYGKLAKNGIVVPSEIHAYVVEQSIGSTASFQIKEREKVFVQPLVEAIGDGVRAKRFTYDEVQNFLYALHAPERNAYLRERGSKSANPSGMSEAEAAKIVADAKAKGTFAELMGISRKVDDIVTDINMTRVRTGQITPSVLAGSPFRNWVPLRDTDDVDPYDEISKAPRADGIGRAFTSWGVRPDKRMFGRTSKAGDIVANLISLQAVTVMRGERARVGKALIDTLTTLPNAKDVLRDDLEIITKPPTKLAYGADGMIREIVDPDYRGNPDIVVFKVDGKEVVLRSGNPRLVAALKGTLVEQMGPILQLVSQAARFRASIITSRDPAFVLTNLSRDAIEAMINAGQYGVPGLAAKMLANIPRAAVAISRYQLGGKDKIDPKALAAKPVQDRTPEEFYYEMEENGWIVSFLAPQNIQRIMQKVQRDVGVLTGTRGAVAKAGKAFDGFMEAWDGVNNVTEGGLRLAFYTEMRKAGASITDAGVAAKNLTINFNKGGTLKPIMNANYLFSSVVMNSVATTGRMLTNKRGRRVLTGVIALGFLLDALNRALSEDDDDNGLKDYDQLTEDELNRNLIFPTRYLWGQDLKLPVAVGPVGALFNMGRNLSRAFDGITNKRQPVSPVASVFNAVASTVDALNPVGDSNRPANLIAPWYLDPWIDLYANRNWADMNIVPQTFDSTKPESQKYYRTTDDIYINTAQGLNALTGGNESRKGWFDFSPEQYKYVSDFLTGGTGRFLLDSAYAMGDARELWLEGKGDLIQTGRIPILKRFIPTTAVERGGSDIFYKLKGEVQTTENELKSDDPETRAAGRTRVAAKGSVRGAFNQAEAQLKILRAQLTAAQQNKTMASTARLAKIEEIKNKMQDVMDKAVKRYYDALEKAP